MRTIISMLSCLVIVFGGLAVYLSSAYGQTLPDLIVSNIVCSKPEGNVAFMITNSCHCLLPANFNAVADVYVNGVKKGSVNLRTPSSGSLTAGINAYYRTGIYISSSSSVKVVVDPFRTVAESNELNNSKTVTLAPCASTTTTTTTPDANVSLDYQQK